MVIASAKNPYKDINGCFRITHVYMLVYKIITFHMYIFMYMYMFACITAMHKRCLHYYTCAYM